VCSMPGKCSGYGGADSFAGSGDQYAGVIDVH